MALKLPERPHVGDLHPNDPCLHLWERDRFREGVLCRVQFVRAMHGERMIETEAVLGQSDEFLALDFDIPGGIIHPSTGRITSYHSVAEIMFKAEGLRRRPHSDSMVEFLETGPAEFAQALIQEIAEGELQLSKVSVVGPYVRKYR